MASSPDHLPADRAEIVYREDAPPGVAHATGTLYLTIVWYKYELDPDGEDGCPEQVAIPRTYIEEIGRDEPLLARIARYLRDNFSGKSKEEEGDFGTTWSFFGRWKNDVPDGQERWREEVTFSGDVWELDDQLGPPPAEDDDPPMFQVRFFTPTRDAFILTAN